LSHCVCVSEPPPYGRTLVCYSVCCIMSFSKVCAYEFVGVNFISINILCISLNWYLHHVLHFREEIKVTINFTQRCFISKY